MGWGRGEKGGTGLGGLERGEEGRDGTRWARGGGKKGGTGLGGLEEGGRREGWD